MMVQSGYWAPIRKTEGREWISPTELRTSYDGAEKAAKATNSILPEWTRANPVVRIRRVNITEEQ